MKNSIFPSIRVNNSVQLKSALLVEQDEDIEVSISLFAEYKPKVNHMPFYPEATSNMGKTVIVTGN